MRIEDSRIGSKSLVMCFKEITYSKWTAVSNSRVIVSHKNTIIRVDPKNIAQLVPDGHSGDFDVSSLVQKRRRNFALISAPFQPLI